MSTLHFIAPSNISTSLELIGLMHLVIKHLNGPHELVILGDEEDAKRMREYGFLVVGFISSVIINDCNI